jgi:hypothetical protein
VTGNLGGARCGREQRRQHAQRRRLASTVRPEEADDLTLRNVDVDSLDRVDGSAATLERTGQPACGDHVHASERRGHRSWLQPSEPFESTDATNPPCIAMYWMERESDVGREPGG